MTDKRARFQTDLNEFGELHVTLESGDEFHIHRHDTRVTQTGYVYIDSHAGEWTFNVESIESVEYPVSHKV